MDDLKQLQKEWYHILKEDGFKDIETFSPSMEPNDILAKSKCIRDLNKLVEANNEEYYRQARGFLHEYSFKKPIHKLMWELHSEGVSNRLISKHLECVTISQVKYLVANTKVIMKGFLSQNHIDKDSKPPT